MIPLLKVKYLQQGGSTHSEVDPYVIYSGKPYFNYGKVQYFFSFNTVLLSLQTLVISKRDIVLG